MFDLQETVDTVSLMGLFVSLCTIQRRPNPPTVDASGWPDYSVSPTGYQPVAGLTSIPCMKAVENTAKPDKYGVSRQPNYFEEMGYYHTLLNGPYTSIKRRDIATIVDPDGTSTVYEVMAREEDSQQVMTRMALRFWKL